MKSKIIGGYEFISKKSGKSMVNLSVTDDRVGSLGIACTNVMVTKDKMPCDLKDMINKTYWFDVSYVDGGLKFGNNFNEFK